MLPENIYFGMHDKGGDTRIALLQQLLNIILNPSPNLQVSGKYDDKTREALKSFERGIESNNGKKTYVYGRASIFPLMGRLMRQFG